MDDNFQSPDDLFTSGAFPKAPPPKISGDEDFNALKPGARFLDPEGKTRQKPWTVTGNDEYGAVPEGEMFYDPNGVLRRKPKYEGLSFTAQTLYDMAANDREREKALAYEYGPEAVKKTEWGNEFYVETPEGDLLAPGRGHWLPRAGAYALSEAAPVIGAVVGGLAAAPVGFVGSIGGAALGGAAGESFNDVILSLMGVYDRSVGEQATNLAETAALSGAGEGAGRLLGAAYPLAVNALGGGASKYPARLAANVLGANVDPQATLMAEALTKQGVKVPPSAWLKEAPYLHIATETFDPAFRTQDVLAQSATRYYAKKANTILDALGVPKTARQEIGATEAEVSSEEAGRAVIGRVTREMAEEDAHLANAATRAKEEATAKFTGQEAGRQRTLESLKRAAESNIAAAQKVVDKGFDDIDAATNTAVKAAAAGNRSGDLWRQAAQRITLLNKAVKAKATRLYDAADAAAGDSLPETQGLQDAATMFLESLPETVRGKAPDLVKAIKRLGAVEEGVEPATFAQLRRLRSMLRQDIDYADLTPSMREGVLKYFSGLVDDALHPLEGDPALRTAAEMLDKADAFYAKNMKYFRDKVVDGIVRGVEAGMPADPALLAREILKPGQTERISYVRKVVGKSTWNAIQAADTRHMLDMSKTLVPGEIDGKTFARLVLEREREGILTAGYDKGAADQLKRQAQNVLAAAEGGNVSLKNIGDETVRNFLERAQTAIDASKELAGQDPLGALKIEIGRIDAEAKIATAVLKEGRAADPLSAYGMPNKSVLANQAADKIIGDADLLSAAARRFGVDSQEFTLLRQVAAERLLQKEAGAESKFVGGFTGFTPQTQALLFPGVTLEDAKVLAKHMDFLLSSRSGLDAGPSMAASSRILHPVSSLAGPLQDVAKTLMLFGGVDAVARVVLMKYYQLLSAGVTHPGFVRWIADGVRAGPVERMAIRDALQTKYAHLLGSVGAGSGAALGGTDGGLDTGPRPTPERDWRKRLESTQ